MTYEEIYEVISNVFTVAFIIVAIVFIASLIYAAKKRSFEDWTLIGWIVTGKGENLDEVPKWVCEFMKKTYLQKGRSYYLKGRTFVYRIDVLPAAVQGYEDIYIYKRLRRKKRKEIKKDYNLQKLGVVPAQRKRRKWVKRGIIATCCLIIMLALFLVGTSKIVIKKCEDGTIYGECSLRKPYYCDNGTLVERASICGCPAKYVQNGDSCVYQLTLGPADRYFKYYLRGNEFWMKITVYKGLKDYLANKPRTILCDPKCPSDAEIFLSFVNQEDQVEFIKELIDKIRLTTNDRDDQARIAISLVQHIPYDYEKARMKEFKTRYPYEVLYDEKGVCGEKSMLLALLLKQLGFGVALLNFEKENHMAVGIKCPKEYSNYVADDTGYCFVEATKPTIVTYIPETYENVGELKSTPEIIVVADGATFNAYEEYKDAREWESLLALAKKNNHVLDPYHYSRWQYLVMKYDIPTK